MPKDGPFRTSVPYETIDLSPWRGLPAATHSRELFLADELVSALVAARCARTLAAISEREVREDRRYAFEWLRRLLATFDASAWTESALAAALEQAPALRSTVELVEAVSSSYPAFLRGEIEGPSILFGKDALPLWPKYFDDANPCIAAINALGAAAAENATAGKTGLRALEVGGGCGSGALALLAKMQERIGEYVFTEISPRFLRMGGEAAKARFPHLNLVAKRVDVNSPLSKQGVQGELDFVYAVNTLHCARDLVASLRELEASLRRGGVLVLAEAIRPRKGFPVPIEFVFQLTNEFRVFERIQEMRETGGFLHWESWRALLERAGFARVRFVPELEAAIRALPNYTMAAIVAEAA